MKLESKAGVSCPVCTIDFEPGDTVTVFACSETHMVHEGCYKKLLKNTAKYVKPKCPICHKIIV